MRQRREGIFHSLQQSTEPARNSCEHKLLALSQRRYTVQHMTACRDTAPFLWWGDYSQDVSIRTFPRFQKTFSLASIAADARPPA